LGLSLNKIEKINPLTELKQLEKAHLGGNQISDTSPIKQLSNLKSVDLRDNKPPLSVGEAQGLKEALPNTQIIYR
jgi:Leucine-rich repeat (LRR) protein